MTFDEVLKAVSELSSMIEASSFKPDYLVGLTRGGWVPTRLLSNTLRVKDILSIGIKYSDAERTTLVTYSKPEPMPYGKKLLLIEDCLESGKVLQSARQLLTVDNEVRTAALYIMNQTEFPPDFYLKRLPKPPKFPWEDQPCK